MSGGRSSHWTGPGSSGYPGMPRMSGFAADVAAWARSSQLRVGDTDRDAAVQALGEHFAAGRLTPEEFEERSTAACSARTAGELTALFGDLPRLAPGGAAPLAPHRQHRQHRPRFPWVPAAVLAIVVAVLTPVPFLVVLLVAWLCFVSLVRPTVTRWHHAHRPHTSGSRRDVRGTWA